VIRMAKNTRELTAAYVVRVRLRNATFHRDSSRDNSSDSEWLPLAAALRGDALTAANGLLAMMLYNGGNPYCVALPPAAAAIRTIATALTAIILALQCLHIILYYYAPMALLKSPGGRPVERFKRFFCLLGTLPWSFWTTLAALLAAAVLLLNDQAAAALPLTILAALAEALFCHQTYGHASLTWSWLLRHPAQMLTISFALLIAVGTYLFMLPLCHAQGVGLEFIPALFTATSGVCITGLTVINISTELNFTGQVVLLVLIQLGAVGVMTISSFVAVAFTNSISLLASNAMQDITGEERSLLAKQLVRLVVPMTLCFELLGAIIFTIYLHSPSHPVELTWTESIWRGIYMSVNAFCNAGFSLSPDGSYICYAREPLPLLLSSSLIILGGLGCGVLAGLWDRLFTRRPFRLPPQAVLVLWTTGILIVVGTLAMLILEYDHTLAAFSWRDKWMNAFFNTVSCRTAGFASIDLAETHRATAVMMRVLMFIGAAPGSTGGGVKVTTVAVMCLMLYAIARGRERVVVGRRTIPETTIHRAAAAIIMNLLMIIIVTLLLSRHMPEISLNYLSFEATSASSTVGLSLGFTHKLGRFGQLLIALTMFSGRIGMLTTLAMFANGEHRTSVVYPDSRVQVG